MPEVIEAVKIVLVCIRYLPVVIAYIITQALHRYSSRPFGGQNGAANLRVHRKTGCQQTAREKYHF